MKKFWKKTEGFTLVELVVVIAILGILAGVGTVGYSGYVKKANMAADQQLASDVEQALMLAYYGGVLGDRFSGSVVLSAEEAVEVSDPVLGTAMENAFGSSWQDMKLKYNGWTSTSEGSKEAVNNSNFSDGNGGVNMELLNSVDNLTGQLGQAMSVLDWDNFDGFTGFLEENGINKDTDKQLAANSAVLYLSQTSMDKTKRQEVANQLVQHFGGKTGYNDYGEVEVNLYDFMVNTADKCTEFEALAMVYAAMTGYCLQKGEDTYNEFVAMDLLKKDASGKPTVGDEGDVLRALEDGFAKILTTEDGDFDQDPFYEYLTNGLVNDVNAYYGVIDGISENREYLRENLNGSENFYASQRDFLTAYWNTEFESGDIAVIFSVNENGQPQTAQTGNGVAD